MQKYMCMYICIFVYTDVVRHTWEHVCMYRHKYTYYTHTYAGLDDCMYVHMYACVCIYAIWMYTFKDIYWKTYMSLYVYA